jgi:hypothetical protein
MLSAVFAMNSAMAESKWLESSRLGVSDVRLLCERVSGVRQLARMQMIASGNERWRSLSRRELVVEAAIMGIPPLDPDRCYAIVRAGPAGDSERRAFEVRDFAVGTERTSVFVVGRAHEQP